MFYISTMFCEIISNGMKCYRADTISILKITKEDNSAKNVDGVTFVYICTSSGHAFISTNFCKTTSNSIKVIERTRFLY